MNRTKNSINFFALTCNRLLFNNFNFLKDLSTNYNFDNYLFKPRFLTHVKYFSTILE